MSDKFIPPPPIDEETMERTRNSDQGLTDVDLLIFEHNLKHDPKLKKYRDLLDQKRKREKQQKWKNRWDWLANNWADVASVLLAIIGILVSLILSA